MSKSTRTADDTRLSVEPILMDSAEFLVWQEAERKALGVPDPMRLTVVAAHKPSKYTRAAPERDNPKDHATMVASVANEKVEWLWRRYIPLGYITMLDGEPDKGKSLMTLDLIARVTTGVRMPDGSRGIAQAGAVIWTVEDGTR